MRIPLKPLIDEEEVSVILGRSSGSHKKSGMQNLMELGVVTEKQSVGENYYGYKVHMDAEFPHVIFVCGKRGSGKSYTLGILAEELASQDTGIGVVIIDPIGIFWSMKRANKNAPERRALKKWGREARAFENVRVLAPVGFYDDMANTCDDAFAISPSDLNAEDWCQMFDIDRFKAQGLLIGDVIDKVRRGYRARLGSKIMTVPGMRDYSLGDMVQCIKYDMAINSKEEGYAPPTKRSVIARFKAASRWGIFATEGTLIGEVSVPDQVTVIDVSHPKLGDARRSLVVGILGRKILENRIETSRSEDAKAMGVDVNVKTNIPVTWLLIDEAHLMIPHTGQSVASSSLIEYAKLGRKPGCGLVLATQRPAATNDDILSQVDMLIGHNLALEDDMTALRRRMPAKVPNVIAESDFIRALPVGTGIIADQKTQERTMVVQFRPRYTHHSGKAAKPTGVIMQEKLAAQEQEPLAIIEGGDIADDTPEIFKPTLMLSTPAEELPDEPDDDEEVDYDDEDEEEDEEDGEVEDAPQPAKREYLPGNTYLVYADDQDKYYFQYLKHIKANEANGLCMSRTHPDKLEQRYPELDSEFYWLSKTSGDDCVSPTNLQAVMSTINNYVKENENSAVLLDGLEYLISNNDFQKTLALIQGLNEKVVLNKAVLLIPVDPTSLDAKERGVLEKEVDYVVNLGPEIIDPREKMRQDLENLTKDRLEDLCRERGLKRSGSKDDLIERLIGAPEDIPMVEQKTHDEIKEKLKAAMDEELKKLEEQKEKEYLRRMEEMEKDRKRMEAEEQKRLREAQRQMEAEAKKLEKIRLQMEKEKQKEEERKRRKKEEEEDRRVKAKHQKEIEEREAAMAAYKQEMEELRQRQKELEDEKKRIENERKQAEAERQKRLAEEEKARQKRLAEQERERKKQLLEEERAKKKAVAERKKKLAAEARAREKEKQQRDRERAKAERERLKKEAALRKDLEKQKASKEAARKREQAERDKLAAARAKARGGAPALTIKNRISGFEAAKVAEKQIRTTLLGKKKEVMSEVSPRYAELLRFRVRAVSGFAIFSKETTMYIVYDNYSQEFVTGFGKKGLSRTRGADHLLGLTQNQIRVMLTLSKWGTTPEKAAKKADIDPGATKRTLGQLVTKNLAKTKFVKADNETFYYPTFVQDDLERSDVLSKENMLPRAVTGEPSKEILTKKLKSAQVESFIDSFLPETKVVDVEYVYYPYFLAHLKGKSGKRRIYVDAVTGTLDKYMSDL